MGSNEPGGGREDETADWPANPPTDQPPADEERTAQVHWPPPQSTPPPDEERTVATPRPPSPPPPAPSPQAYPSPTDPTQVRPTAGPPPGWQSPPRPNPSPPRGAPPPSGGQPPWPQASAGGGFPPPPPPSGKAPRNDNRRWWILGAAATVAVVVIGAVVLSTSGDDGSAPPDAAPTTSPMSSPAATTTSAPATTAQPDPPAPAAPALIAPDALSPLLLSAEQISERMGTPGMTPGPIEHAPVNTGTVTPPNCTSTFAPVDNATYNGSGFTGMSAQPVSGPENHRVIQAVVSFPTAEAAQAFYDREFNAWQACKFTKIEARYGGLNTATVGVAANTDGTAMVLVSITNKPEAPTLACQRAMTARANVVVDVRACSPSVGSAGWTLARDIGEKITGQR